MKKQMKQIGWAIKGIQGLYTGWWFTRRKAIYAHTEELSQTWASCRRQGDYVIKVMIKEIRD